MSVATTTDLANLALSRIGARRITDLDTDTTPEAESCRLHIHLVRDELLRRHHWNFAIARKTLLAAATPWLSGIAYTPGQRVSKAGNNYTCVGGHTSGYPTSDPVDGSDRLSYWSAPTPHDQLTDPATEWATAWQLPPDLVRFTRLATDAPGTPPGTFAIEGRTLLLPTAEPPTVIFVTNAAPISEWDSLFIQAFAYLLAHHIASDITQNGPLAQQMLQSFHQLALPEAQRADAREVRSGENFGTAHMIRLSGLVASRLQ